VGRWAFIVAGPLLFVALSSSGMAQAPLPILRGIIVMPSGDSRAYFEDAQTGHLAGYAVRDLVGDSRVEEIRDDRVVLRHGGYIVHVFLGGVSASRAPSPLLPGVKAGPAVDNGEAWLNHLGIPSKALSQAIERVPTKGPDNLEDD
jgi:hypothetical protein